MKTPSGLQPLIDDGVIDAVMRPLKSGKEAAVYVVRAGDEIRCAKVYKDMAQRSFQQRVQYQEGRKVRGSREARAIGKASKYGRKQQETAWKNTEVEALYALRDAGVRVPEPYGYFHGVLVMELKEDIVPANANKFIHTLAPILSIAVALITIAVVPFGNTIELFGYQIKLMIADVNVGILYILALTSLGVYGVTLSGWSSNNKYSLLGGLRSSAQLISYELSMGLSIIGVIMLAGTLELDKIVEMQAHGRWFAFLTPLGFITFVVASFAETNRLPFDLPEAEPELVGGYHTEYTGMKFGAFFLAEYANMITSSALIVTLFLGGWQLPGLHYLGLSPLWVSLLQVLAFVLKVAFMLFFYIWIRWTIPRFRYDQLMNLGWKVMLPLALANLFIVGVLHFAFPGIW